MGKELTSVKVGCKVRVFKDDGADDHYGIKDELRWHIGDELIVTDIHIFPFGTFLCNYKGQNVNMNRVEFVDANIQENLQSIKDKIESIHFVDTGAFLNAKFKSIEDAKECHRYALGYINDFEERERNEFRAWLEKEGRQYEYEALAECSTDYAGDQRNRLDAGGEMDKIKEEFQKSRQ